MHAVALRLVRFNQDDGIIRGSVAGRGHHTCGAVLSPNMLANGSDSVRSIVNTMVATSLMRSK
jgi:hypothetical protein